MRLNQPTVGRGLVLRGLAAIVVIRRPGVFRAAVSGAAPSMEAAWAGRRLERGLIPGVGRTGC